MCDRDDLNDLLVELNNFNCSLEIDIGPEFDPAVVVDFQHDFDIGKSGRI